jgi:hypothetical protein
MTPPPVERYRILLTQLLFEREAAGGDLWMKKNCATWSCSTRSGGNSVGAIRS